MRYFLPLILSLFVLSCDNDNNDNQLSIWEGPTISFTKADNTDPNLVENQDRITDNIWITRPNGGGQIYNIRTETAPESSVSPEGTLWAIGTIDQIDTLQFEAFRAAVGSPQQVVGKELVLQLIEEQIYISVRFTSWSPQGLGGFSYERSTQ